MTSVRVFACLFSCFYFFHGTNKTTGMGMNLTGSTPGRVLYSKLHPLIIGSTPQAPYHNRPHLHTEHE